MRTVLTRILTAFLAAGTTLSVSATPQVMKKAGGHNMPRVELTAKAQTKAAKSQAKKRNLLDQIQSRRLDKAAGFSGSRKAATAKLPGKKNYVHSAAGVMPELRGSVTFSDAWAAAGEAAYGLYTVPTQAGENFEMLIADVNANYGGVEVDGIYWAHNYENFMGFLQFFTVMGYDMETGEQIANIEVDPSKLCPGGVTLDPSTGVVYGITFDESAENMVLSTLAYSTSDVTVTPIATLDGNWNSIAAAPNGDLYGIKYYGETQGENFVVTSSELVKFDKTNGTYTVIGQTGMTPQYMTSATIDPKSGRMFWTVCPPDETGMLCEVNLSTGAATVLYDFPDNNEVMGLYVPAPAAEDGAPAKVSGLELSFPEGSLSGTVDFVAPTTLVDGSNGVGEITYKVLVDGEEAAAGSTAYGATVNASVTIAEAGEHTFVVYCSNATGDGLKTKITKFIGKGVPAAPVVTAEYADGTANVAWTPVTTSADGGYVNPAEVTYTVTRYPDAVVVLENSKETTFSEPLAEPASIVSYTYGVKASYNNTVSAEGKSNAIVLGSIVPPYTQDFEGEDALGGFTLIDANNDGKTWALYDGRARIGYNSSLDMDDWLITPPMKLEAGKAYKVSFKAASNGTAFPERLEVKWGNNNTAAAMTNVLLEPTILQSSIDAEFSKVITPQADGTYFIGFHGMSDADQFYLYVDDISIAAGISSAAPGLATNLAAKAADYGEKKATITFNAPAVDFSGTALASLTKVELLRDNEVINTFNAPAPGAALTFADNLPAAGTYTYSVVGYNAEGAGDIASTSVYVGYDYPEAPAQVTLTEDQQNPGTVTVTWSSVGKDVSGANIGYGKVKYDLYVFEGNDRVLVAGDLTDTSYTYAAVPEGQAFMQYAVFAKTERGEGEGQISDMLAIGQPYTSFDESFADGNLHYITGLMNLADYGEANAKIYNDESFTDLQSCDGDNGFIGIQGQYLDDALRLFTGKIDLSAIQNPAFTFYTYNIGGDDVNEISILVRKANDEEWTNVLTTTVLEAAPAEGWNKITVNLAAFAGQTVQIAYQGVVKQYNFILFDALKVATLADNDLALSAISAPATVKAGEDYKVDVTVANDGGKDAAAYTVELYANNEKVDSKAGEALASGKAATVSFDRSMSALATEPVTYKAVVVYAADEVLTNNESTEIVVAPVVSKLPVVKDLKAVNSNGANKLTWSEPDLTAAAPEEITEDFENATAWAHEYGDWTFVDEDQAAIGGFQGMDVPGITPGETKASFFVWDQTDGVGNQTFDAHSGMKYLAGLFRYDDQEVSDWAISPELYGGAQTISFFAKSYSSSYPDKFEVYYSTGSLDPKDFIKVLDMTEAPKDWTEFTAEIPEGAKHFAIHSCAAQSFMIMIDDVTFTPAGAAANLSIVGYDIYRNGEKINAEPVAECEFTDAAGKAGDLYQVVVIYNKGLSAGSNEAAAESALNEIAAGVKVATAQGTIIITGAEGLDVTIVAVDGKVLHSGIGDATVSVETGVYVVKAGEKIVKVLVK